MLFQNEYRFLSNMAYSPFEYIGVRYLSSEAMYQSMKLKDPYLRKVFEDISGKDAKKLAKYINKRDDWDDVQVYTMVLALTCKFLKTDLYKKLQSVQGYIEETNTWNDQFWGVCGGKGENVLGQILMLLRDDEHYKLWRMRNQDVVKTYELVGIDPMLEIVATIVGQVKTI